MFTNFRSGARENSLHLVTHTEQVKDRSLESFHKVLSKKEDVQECPRFITNHGTTTSSVDLELQSSNTSFRMIMVDWMPDDEKVKASLRSKPRLIGLERAVYVCRRLKTIEELEGVLDFQHPTYATFESQDGSVGDPKVKQILEAVKTCAPYTNVFVHTPSAEAEGQPAELRVRINPQYTVKGPSSRAIELFWVQVTSNGFKITLCCKLYIGNLGMGLNIIQTKGEGRRVPKESWKIICTSQEERVLEDQNMLITTNSDVVDEFILRGICFNAKVLRDKVLIERGCHLEAICIKPSNRLIVERNISYGLRTRSYEEPKSETSLILEQLIQLFRMFGTIQDREFTASVCSILPKEWKYFDLSDNQSRANKQFKDFAIQYPVYRILRFERATEGSRDITLKLSSGKVNFKHKDTFLEREIFILSIGMPKNSAVKFFLDFNFYTSVEVETKEKKENPALGQVIIKEDFNRWNSNIFAFRSNDSFAVFPRLIEPIRFNQYFIRGVRVTDEKAFSTLILEDKDYSGSSFTTESVSLGRHPCSDVINIQPSTFPYLYLNEEDK